MGLLAIVFETGESLLPAEIQALRFRIEEVHLKTKEGEWLVFPIELNSFEINSANYIGKTILSTRVQPVAYDSLALKLTDVFVLFGENAGGPLTMPRDKAHQIPVAMHPKVGEGTQVRIKLEPGASVFKDRKCRWYFVPFSTAGVTG